MDKNYELFIKQLINGIHGTIGIPMENMEFARKGENFAEMGDRLLVKIMEHEDACETCRLYTEDLFEAYQKGCTLKEILGEILGDIQRFRKAGVYDKTKKLQNYDAAKTQLFVRLVNRDRYAVDLNDAIRKDVGDIALVVYVRISAEENCVTSTKVREAMLNYWRKDHPELNTNDIFDEAIANTYRMTPPRIYKWEEMIFNREYTGDSFMESCDEDVISKDAMSNCLSTTIKTNGAVAVFLPGVAEHLAELLNSDFYMVFTSIHEVMIHSVKSGVDPKDLKLVLRDTLREVTPSSDYLTEKIYKYNRRTHKFECVTD